MLDIRAYGDESDDPKGHFVLTCAFARFSEWEKFRERWSDLLDREGLTEFKAANCSHGKGEFARWKDDNQKRMSLYREFLETITSHDIHTAAVVVEQASYHVIAKALGLSKFAKPWPFAFSQLLPLVAARVPKTESIAFLFDEQREHKGKVKEAFDIYKQFENLEHLNLSSKLRRIDFGDSKKYPPLQAADQLGYEVRLRFRSEWSPRKSWEAIEKGGLQSITISYIGEAKARQFVALKAEMERRGVADFRQLSEAECEEILSRTCPPVDHSHAGILKFSGNNLMDLPMPDWGLPDET